MCRCSTAVQPPHLEGQLAPLVKQNLKAYQIKTKRLLMRRTWHGHTNADETPPWFWQHFPPALSVHPPPKVPRCIPIVLLVLHPQ